jgi:urease accessory protein
MTAAPPQSAALAKGADSVDGWQALLQLRLQKINNRTCLLPQQRLGPLTVQRPFYPEGDTCHVYLLHPPGGVVGGDQLRLDVEVRAGAHGLITTPGASKFYRSAGKTAGLQQQFNVDGDAILEFLPQENIYFPATEVSSKIDVNLAASAKYAGWEVHSFGLPANAADLSSGNVQLKTEIKIAGRLLLHDQLKINEIDRGRLSGLRGNRVYGSFVVVSPMISDELIAALQAVPVKQGLTGVSRVEKNILVARYLGDSTAAAHNYFRQLWTMSRPVALGVKACTPRIWNT